MKRRTVLTLIGAGSLAGCFSDGREAPTTGTSSTVSVTPTKVPTRSPTPTEETPTETRTPTETHTPTRTPTPGMVESLPPPTMGNADADVTVMAFQDYACPHCRDFSLVVLPELKSEYIDPGTIHYEHHDYPLPVNEWSWPVANAARAVQDLSTDAVFFEYSRDLYENQSDYSWDLVATLADELGVDGTTVQTAAKVGRYRPVLKADRQRAIDMEALGTPQVYVNGNRMADWSYRNIRRAIESSRES